MSEMTATRIAKGATLAVGAGVWCACALLLARTSVPSLHLSGLDVHRYFAQRSLERAASYSRGVEALWVARVAATLAALVVLTRVGPRRIGAIGLGRVEHVAGTPIRVQDVSGRTDQPNAFMSGCGPSATVILWSTLLDGRFTRGEQDAVIAHELGHVRSRHIVKGIGWAALVALPA